MFLGMSLNKMGFYSHTSIQNKWYLIRREVLSN